MAPDPASTEPSPPAATQPAPISEPVDTTRYDTVAQLSMPNAVSGMAFSAVTPSLHTINLDAGAAYGGVSSGPEPLGLLLVSLGVCTGMDVISIMRKKRQKVTHYTINVYANQQQEHPRVYTDIMVEHVLGGENLDPAAIARSIELSITRYCPAHAMLSQAARIEHVYRVLE